MPRVEGGGVFVDGPNLLALESNEPGVSDLIWNGWLPLYSLEGRSPADRARAHAINVVNRRLSVAAFGRSMERLVEAARRCRTEDEVIALGRPRLSYGPAEPGAQLGERQDISGIDRLYVRVVRDTLGELGRIRASLAGRRMPLDVKADLRAALLVDGDKGSCSVGASASGGLSARCKGAVGAGGRLGADGLVSGAVSAGPVTVATSGDRIESVELSGGPAYARLGRSSAALGLGVKRGLATGPAGVRVSAELRLGVDVELLDAETVRRALSREDWWAKKW
jgi:hypothetical protein